MASPKRLTVAIIALAAASSKAFVARQSLHVQSQYYPSCKAADDACCQHCRPSRLDGYGATRLGSGEADDLEADRKKLESLLGGAGSDSSKGSSGGINDDLSDADDWAAQLAAGPPPLTSIGAERVKTEIALIKSLAEGDGAVSQLWNLWYNERGPGPAAELAATDLLVSRGSGSYVIAEEMLRALIKREGVYWTEAVNRLATLLFLRGKYQESKEACEVVLKVKPWHFGALSGIVMVCQGLNDLEGVVHWAGRRMPPIEAQHGQNIVGEGGVVKETRADWVKRVVDEAEKRLSEREARTGSQDSIIDDAMDDNASSEGIIFGEEDDGAGAWQ